MQARSKSFRKQDGKSSLSPTAVLGLLLAVLAAVAVLTTWKPWERTSGHQTFRKSSDATNSTGSAPATPTHASAQATAAASATNADVLALMNEGNELIQRGDTEGAIQKYRAAMKINPEDEEVHFNLGFAFARQGNTNEAMRCYNEALRIKPDFADTGPLTE